MNLFHREQRSLFGEILDWMLVPLMLLLPVALALTWVVAQDIAGKPFDRALEHNARALSQLLGSQGEQVVFNLPQPAREILRADDTDLIYYQVLAPDKRLLSGERDFPAPTDADTPRAGVVQLRDDSMRGHEIRVAWIWVRPDAPASRGLALVQVAETREKRAVLATEIIKGVLLPQLALLPLAVLLVWLALVRGIQPLSELEARIRARRPDDLSPLDESVAPMEVAPLVASVNDLLTRLKDSIATQKRFLADAAHQLKTPLAGLRMQADLAQRHGASAAELMQSLAHIERASIRATHTVNQLLALARAEAGGATLTRLPCDLPMIAREVVQDLLPRALERHVDLGYDGLRPGEDGARLMGNETLLKELVRNVVDNALTYTPSTPQAPGVVTVRVWRDANDGQLVLQVEDNGPGIPESEHQLVFQPFYRALGTGADGSGLGLSIVREIADQHGATLSLAPAHPGQTPPGLLFTARFPAPAPPPAPPPEPPPKAPG